MASMTKAPILDFSIDSKPRETVRIDGTSYTLRGSDDLTIQQSNELGNHLKTIHLFTQQGKSPVSRLAKEQLGRALTSAVQIVLVAPPNIRKKLSPVMQLRIATVFLALSLEPMLKTAKANQASAAVRKVLNRSNGRTSSQGSKGSTAASRSRGSRSTRSA